MAVNYAHWHELAACRGKQELFFSEHPDREDEAQQICLDDCPVLNECSAWIAANPQPFGVWAGTTPRERLQADPRQVVRCGTPEGYRRHLRKGHEACPACKEAWRRKAAARTRNGHQTYLLRKTAERKKSGLCYSCAWYKHTRHQAGCPCQKCEPGGLPPDSSAIQLAASRLKET